MKETEPPAEEGLEGVPGNDGAKVSSLLRSLLSMVSNSNFP